MPIVGRGWISFLYKYKTITKKSSLEGLCAHVAWAKSHHLPTLGPSHLCLLQLDHDRNSQLSLCSRLIYYFFMEMIDILGVTY